MFLNDNTDYIDMNKKKSKNIFTTILVVDK